MGVIFYLFPELAGNGVSGLGFCVGSLVFFFPVD